MPATVIMVRGKVRHMRPLPSDSTTTAEPVFSDEEVGASNGGGDSEKFPAEPDAGGSGQGFGIVGEICEAHAADEDFAT